MKLVTVAQTRAIEKEADTNGLTYAEMMENAGRRLVAERKKTSKHSCGHESLEVFALFLMRP